MSFFLPKTYTHTHTHTQYNIKLLRIHVGLRFYDKYGWQKVRNEWVLSDARDTVVQDMGLAEYGETRRYDSFFNEETGQFEIKIYTATIKNRIQLFEATVKYNRNNKQLIISCVHLKSGIQSVTTYIKA